MQLILILMFLYLRGNFSVYCRVIIVLLLIARSFYAHDDYLLRVRSVKYHTTTIIRFRK